MNVHVQVKRVRTTYTSYGADVVVRQTSAIYRYVLLVLHKHSTLEREWPVEYVV